mmetsp:Transcript_30459/g.93081  ORF Transcript_30459/g.93081 Transcript_30459/m.93081 type:complete len:211 (-) Transcript_30459:1709-2341(-)|eukprot:scaffold47259_cov24-Tisochrysis_lutea.AAC.2
MDKCASAPVSHQSPPPAASPTGAAVTPHPTTSPTGAAVAPCCAVDALMARLARARCNADEPAAEVLAAGAAALSVDVSHQSAPLGSSAGICGSVGSKGGAGATGVTAHQSPAELRTDCRESTDPGAERPVDAMPAIGSMALPYELLPPLSRGPVAMGSITPPQPSLLRFGGVIGSAVLPQLSPFRLAGGKGSTAASQPSMLRLACGMLWS